MATRWACIGTGRIARDFFHSIQDNLSAEHHEHVAVASSELSKAKQFAEEFGFKKAYGSYEEVAYDEDVEVVYISTLPNNHMELSIKMLEAGKHVLCEKPMTMNLKEAKQVIKTARTSKRLFVEGTWYRHFPAYDHVREELEAGRLGIIRMVQANIMFPGTKWQPVPSSVSSGVLGVGCYLTSLATMILQEMPETIKAVGILSDALAHTDVGGSFVLQYKNGAMACMTYHFDTKVSNNSAIIVGTDDMIQISAPFWAPEKVTTPSGVFEYPLKKGDYNYGNSAGLHYEATAVREAILQGKLEMDACPCSHSEISLAIMDEVRRQIGVEFPGHD